MNIYIQTLLAGLWYSGELTSPPTFDGNLIMLPRESGPDMLVLDNGVIYSDGYTKPLSIPQLAIMVCIGAKDPSREGWDKTISSKQAFQWFKETAQEGCEDLYRGLENPATALGRLVLPSPLVYLIKKMMAEYLRGTEAEFVEPAPEVGVEPNYDEVNKQFADTFYILKSLPGEVNKDYKRYGNSALHEVFTNVEDTSASYIFNGKEVVYERHGNLQGGDEPPTSSIQLIAQAFVENCLIMYDAEKREGVQYMNLSYDLLENFLSDDMVSHPKAWKQCLEEHAFPGVHTIYAPVEMYNLVVECYKLWVDNFRDPEYYLS